jgi:hypothetical protein
MGKPVEKTALKGMMAKVSAKGLGALDKRSAGYIALKGWQEQLTKDLGGDLSTQERTLVELITRTKLFLDSIDLFLMEQPSLVNKKKRAGYAILATRNSMANTLANLLNQIGLSKREPPMKSLAEYIAERDSKNDGHNPEHAGPEVISEDVPAEEAAVASRD